VKVSLATKLRWFDRGAAAFSQASPEALSHLGPEAPPYYVCPECPEADAAGRFYRVQLFPRAAVQSNASPQNMCQNMCTEILWWPFEVFHEQ